MIWRLMNDELNRMWKKAVVVYFNVLFQHCRRGAQKSREKPVRKAGVLTTIRTKHIRNTRSIIFLSDTALNSYVFKKIYSRYSTA
jgi:hypothetical protein